MTATSCRRAEVAVVCLLVVCLAPASPIGQAQDARAQRAESTLVRLDVYAATEDGQPVADLTAADFQIREDNVPQTVATFERVVVGAAGPAVPGLPSADSARPLAPGERARILVIFLDTLHTDPAAARAVHGQLVEILDGALSPDDVVAVMTPEMAAHDVTFRRKTSSVASTLAPYTSQAPADGERRSPEYARYEACFPEQGGGRCVDAATGRDLGGANPYEGVAREMAARAREQRVMTALSELTQTLGGLSEARKAVLVISGGWHLPRVSARLARLGRCGGASPRARGRVQPRGESAEPPRAADGVDRTICEADRRRLSQLDLQYELRSLMGAANRATVSFSTIDAHALAGAAAAQPAAGEEGGGSRSGSLETLAETTDGVAMASAGSVAPGVERLVSDLSAYYLIGYHSTNARADGGHRRVSVSVARRGVTVRSRPGYRAVTAGEIDRQRTAAALAGQTLGGAQGSVQAAIAGLQQLKASLPVRSRIAYGPSAGGRLRLWAVTEISAGTAREGAWLGGGTVQASVALPDNRALASTEAALPAGQRAVLLDLGEVETPGTPTSLRIRLQPAGDGPSMADDVALAPMQADAGVPLVLRRGPTTGTRFLPTADLQFRRTERMRVELPCATAPSAFTAALLDRTGSPLAITPATTVRQEDGVVWAVVELALAPLAHGDYAMRMTVDGQHSVTAIRVVP